MARHSLPAAFSVPLPGPGSSRTRAVAGG